MKKKIEFERYFSHKEDFCWCLRDMGLELKNGGYCAEVPIVHKQGEEPVFVFSVYVCVDRMDGAPAEGVTQIAPKLWRMDSNCVDIGKRHLVETGDIDSVKHFVREEFLESRRLFDPSFDWRGELSKKYDWISERLSRDEIQEDQQRQLAEIARGYEDDLALAKPEPEPDDDWVGIGDDDDDGLSVDSFLSGTDAVSDFIGRGDDSDECPVEKPDRTSEDIPHYKPLYKIFGGNMKR